MIRMDGAGYGDSAAKVEFVILGDTTDDADSADGVDSTDSVNQLKNSKKSEKSGKESNSADADAGKRTDLQTGNPLTDQAPLGNRRLLNTNQVESRKSLRRGWHPSDDDNVLTLFHNDSLGVAGGSIKSDRAKVNQTVRISSWDLRNLPMEVGGMDVLSNSRLRFLDKRRSTPNIVTAADNYIDNYFDVVVKELRGRLVGFNLFEFNKNSVI